jgi:WD40 repeat protein
VQVWDALHGTSLITYQRQDRPIWAVAWNPGGACIASATRSTSGTRQQETVHVWNTTTGHVLASYPIASSTPGDLEDGTFSIAWSPDGTHLASGGADTYVLLWKTPAC